jgi:hypothetical protein
MCVEACDKRLTIVNATCNKHDMRRNCGENFPHFLVAPAAALQASTEEEVLVEFIDFDEPRKIPGLNGASVEALSVAQLVVVSNGVRKVVDTAAFPTKLTKEEKDSFARMSKTAFAGIPVPGAKRVEAQVRSLDAYRKDRKKKNAARKNSRRESRR